MAQLRVRLTLQDRVLKAQQEDLKIGKIRNKMKSGIEMSFQIQKDGLIVLGRQMYLPGDQTLKRKVLQEALKSRLATHLGSTKMYQDLKEFYWWSNIKKEVVKYMVKCEICQQVKMEYQKLAGLL
jgi:hypothetical protein